MSLLAEVKKLASQYAEDTVSIRRYIHANPELSFKEFETAKYELQTPTRNMFW